MSIDINNLTQSSLAGLNNEQLIGMVLVLHEENQKLQKIADEISSKNYDVRLEQLEREVNKDKQYSRRDTVEIVGINPEVKDEDIEDECIKILKAAKAKVGSKYPTTYEIHAAHRKNKKGHVIIKFTNRKFAAAAMSNRSNLKDTDFYDTYINQSLCPEFSFLSYAVRKAKKNGEIHFYKLKHGIPHVQIKQNDKFIEISHTNDLLRNGIQVPERS